MTARGTMARALIWFGLTAGTAALAEAPGSWLAALTQQALSSGFEASIPPHVAGVLGLTPKDDGGAVKVRQLVSRADQQVHTFNVTGGEAREVVLFHVDEGSHRTVVYLLRSGGKLRKAVSYESGGEPHELPESEARTGLTHEAHFWASKLSPGAPPAAPPGSQPNPSATH